MSQIIPQAINIALSIRELIGKMDGNIGKGQVFKK
jgi:hypothetical protein